MFGGVVNHAVWETSAAWQYLSDNTLLNLARPSGKCAPDTPITVGWALVGAVSMGVGLAVALKIFTVLTPGIDEIEELKKGNIGVAVVLAAVILAMGLVVAITVLPESMLG